MKYTKKEDQSSQNFWISYADLMAGLLFVFILLIGAIVVKYVFMQSDLQVIKTDLDEQKRVLKLSEEDLRKKKQAIKEMTDKLITSKQDNLQLSFMQAELQKRIDELENNLTMNKQSLYAARALLAEKGKLIEEQSGKLALNENEITTLKNFLVEVEQERDSVISIRDVLNDELNTTNKKLVDTQDLLSSTAYKLTLKEGELKMLAKTLMDKTLAHQQLVEDLNLTKSRIKNLTGIRIKVIQKLKERLGNSIEVDAKSGTIRLPASILFEKKEFKLKTEAKIELKKTLVKYFDALLGDEEIRANVDSIIIEGHSDSDGSYMYNLELSQKRAYEVMDFIYSWDESDNDLLQQYLTASGKSYSNPILDSNGTENKEASRRIEVKFSISNEKAIKEIERFLKR